MNLFLKKYAGHISLIIITCFVYSFLMVRLANLELHIALILINSLVLIVIAFLISGALSLFFLKKWGFPKVFFYSYLIALSLGILSLIGNYSINQKMNVSNNLDKLDPYKKTVNKKSADKVKKVGHVKSEFVNDDNLYENYIYNYAIKFPEDFKLNYGVGEYSQVMAYNKDGGYQIIINAGDNNSDFSFSTKDANKMIKNLDENSRSNFARKLIEKWELEGSYQDIVFIDSEVVTYYNKKFLRYNFTANRNLNNTSYPLIISDFITFYKSNNYHFLFEGIRSNNELEEAIWNGTIFTTMASLRITEQINQDD